MITGPAATGSTRYDPPQAHSIASRRAERPDVLGLPVGSAACLFDLDGVLTDTTTLHTLAWAAAFEPLLSERGLRPFNTAADYARYVDGKPRDAGTRDFLASRGVSVPEGGPEDAPGSETVAGVSALKNALLLQQLEDHGVKAFPGSVAYLTATAAAGLRCAVVSSSANTRPVLEATGLAPLVDVIIDGIAAKDRHLAGKPAPDTFVAAAAALGLLPATCAVFEDSLAGVTAGRAGAFGYVVGVDRHGTPAALLSAGADIVVTDLADLLPPVGARRP